MKQLSKIALFSIILALVLSACAPAATEEAMMDEPEPMMATHTPDAMMDEKQDDSMMEATPEDAMMDATHDPMMEETPEDAMMEKTPDDMMEDEGAMMEAPAWFTAELTNAATGETFTVADFKDKVVLVETMAYWCTNCLAQQRQVKQLHTLLGERDDFVSLGIDIDPNEDIATLKSYIEKNEFDWLYTVAPAEVSRELSQLYGDQFLNPPSTPMLIIDRHGEVHTLPFGIKSAEDLQSAVEMYLNDSM